ncbi:MAG: AF1514 family protein [gamma proteobacterium endosymbiont of Lamellibrachia anaximandri]|nr:AF1514 family protein [gamma proteobacterium endosymbiont of Lamellibrachia anaximandri]
MTLDAEQNGFSCPIPKPPDMSHIQQIELHPDPPLKDYIEAMKLANWEAETRLGENMLLSWYDRDRDFESPQHSSECHQNSAVPGYVDYGVYHGATLKVDVEDGRFVFFYFPVEI